MPMIDRHLASDDGRSALVAVVDELEEITALLAGQRSQAPIEGKELDARQRLEKPSVAAVATRQREGLEQPGRHALWPSAQAIQLFPSSPSSCSPRRSPKRRRRKKQLSSLLFFRLLRGLWNEFCLRASCGARPAL